MRTAHPFLVLVALMALVPPAVAAPPRQLRVCSDPNNMPLSNERGEGFENAIARILARELAAELVYTWSPQRRGFLRTTLKANRCDVVMGIPAAIDMVATTRPYYRSGYVFVMAPGVKPVTSLATPSLRTARIGVPMVGDDGANPPPALALASLGLVSNMRSYSVYGDYRQDSPPGDLVRAARTGEIDVALAWGPFAGWFAKQPAPRLEVRPIPDAEAPPGMTFSFDIAVGVRKGDRDLLADLDRALARRKPEVDAVLDSFAVPRL